MSSKSEVIALLLQKALGNLSSLPQLYEIADAQGEWLLLVQGIPKISLLTEPNIELVD